MKLPRFAPLLMLIALAAQPPTVDDGGFRLRAAEEAWGRGDDAMATRLYGAAEERSYDPGLIAFNLGAIHYRKGEFRESDLEFQRALDDREAPTSRRARAFYNRGVCLIRLGGLIRLRTAIEHFNRCLAIVETDSDLERDAEHNLELAKLLWLEARAKSNSKPHPNERPPEEPPEAHPPTEKPGESTNPTGPSGAKTTDASQPGEIDPLTGMPKSEPGPGTKKTTGGRGNLPVNGEWSGWQPQDEAEAREYLKRLGARLVRDRRELIDLTAPPEQTHVKDW